ncbi:MAG: hypothetical protein HY843_08505 [Bdellovibrio sp.]|nr:hypothetical protein [Bdellovibrio sp.]
MDVSNKKDDLIGQDLIDELVKLTGLPPIWVHGEILKIINNKELDSSELTLEGFREALVGYLDNLNDVKEPSLNTVQESTKNFRN